MLKEKLISSFSRKMKNYPKANQIIQCVPKKWGLGFSSSFAVNFIEMTYKLVSRSETVQIKWKNHKVRYFRFWPLIFVISKICQIWKMDIFIVHFFLLKHQITTTKRLITTFKWQQSTSVPVRQSYCENFEPW